MKRIVVILYLIALLFSLIAIGGQVRASSGVTFTAMELLGRPTDTSMTVNVVPSSSGQIYFQYGTTSGGPYTGQTDTAALTSGKPYEVVMSGLAPDTEYYYRMESSLDGISWTPGTEHSFPYPESARQHLHLHSNCRLACPVQHCPSKRNDRYLERSP